MIKVIWLTGLSGSGKSTLAHMLDDYFKYVTNQSTILLDGDIIRETLTPHLGFSKRDRIKQIDTIRTFCQKVVYGRGNAPICIVSAITPYEEMRNKNREILDNYYMEIYVNASVKQCIERDVKGLYKKALDGEIKNFTGLDDPFEEPKHSNVICDTDAEQENQSLAKILGYIEVQKLYNV